LVLCVTSWPRPCSLAITGGHLHSPDLASHKNTVWSTAWRVVRLSRPDVTVERDDGRQTPTGGGRLSLTLRVGIRRRGFNTNPQRERGLNSRKLVGRTWQPAIHQRRGESGSRDSIRPRRSGQPAGSLTRSVSERPISSRKINIRSMGLRAKVPRLRFGLV
jgi:hypothetical protein